MSYVVCCASYLTVFVCCCVVVCPPCLFVFLKCYDCLFVVVLLCFVVSLNKHVSRFVVVAFVSVVCC